MSQDMIFDDNVPKEVRLLLLHQHEAIKDQVIMYLWSAVLDGMS